MALENFGYQSEGHPLGALRFDIIALTTTVQITLFQKYS
jgi:hypothetical protein